jgi:hypothetical protein
MQRIRDDRAYVSAVPASVPKLVTHENPVKRADGSDDEIDDIVGRIARLREGQRARLFVQLREEYGL